MDTLNIDEVRISETTNREWKSIKEGQAEILSKGDVFYNPVQQFNRDLSISVLTTFYKEIFSKEPNTKNEVKNVGEVDEHGMRVLEALSATGLRSIRYAKEVPGIKEIFANDISNSAVETIENNIKHNKVENFVKSSHSNAMTLMYLSTASNKRFNVIDLDPYGCPNRFLDAAVQSLTDGGLLLVTATDMAVLAGNAPEACYVKYGTVPVRMKCCHELALRILLRSIEGHANRYGRYIIPLLSISADFYVRVFVRIFTSQLECKRSMSKQSMIYQCTGCETFTLQPLGILKPNPTQKNSTQVKYAIPTGPFVNVNCEHCNHKHHLGGPIWTEPIYDKEFLEKLLSTVATAPCITLATNKRLLGMLSVIEEELHDIPLYYSADKLCSILHLELFPMMKLRSAILHAGFRVSFSHAYKNSIKTDAPPSLLWDILRCWAKKHPVKKERFIDGTPLKAILDKEPKIHCNFDEIHEAANPASRKQSLSRFPENPTPHWGPGTRATLMISDGKMLKSYRNQNKRTKTKQNDETNDYTECKQIKLKDA